MPKLQSMAVQKMESAAVAAPVARIRVLVTPIYNPSGDASVEVGLTSRIDRWLLEANAVRIDAAQAQTLTQDFYNCLKQSLAQCDDAPYDLVLMPMVSNQVNELIYEKSYDEATQSAQPSGRCTTFHELSVGFEVYKNNGGLHRAASLEGGGFLRGPTGECEQVKRDRLNEQQNWGSILVFNRNWFPVNFSLELKDYFRPAANVLEFRTDPMDVQGNYFRLSLHAGHHLGETQPVHFYRQTKVDVSASNKITIPSTGIEMNDVSKNHSDPAYRKSWVTNQENLTFERIVEGKTVYVLDEKGDRQVWVKVDKREDARKIQMNDLAALEFCLYRNCDTTPPPWVPPSKPLFSLDDILHGAVALHAAGEAEEKARKEADRQKSIALELKNHETKQQVAQQHWDAKVDARGQVTGLEESGDYFRIKSAHGVGCLSIVDQSLMYLADCRPASGKLFRIVAATNDKDYIEGSAPGSCLGITGGLRGENIGAMHLSPRCQRGEDNIYRFRVLQGEYLEGRPVYELIANDGGCVAVSTLSASQSQVTHQHCMGINIETKFTLLPREPDAAEAALYAEEDSEIEESAQQEKASIYQLFIDCDHNDVTGEGTTTGIGIVPVLSHTSSAPAGSASVRALPDIAQYITNAACDSPDAAYANEVDGSPSRKITRVWRGSSKDIGGDILGFSIHSNGNNAFMIDAMRLYQGGNLIAYWGKDNGKAWCLSREAEDDSGDWESLVDGCAARLNFSINPDGKKGTVER